jgi:hypothetical protein
MVRSAIFRNRDGLAKSASGIRGFPDRFPFLVHLTAPAQCRGRGSVFNSA